ncbi:hypothetical protein L207DRAFT_428089 [Hyaloscypha variabilis F]|uniref:Tachykinin family protein n=1 Tax=Hyaloscypha variabilis (strain UAMH 11265 / GT02V1 / F) TaxID=1149755 RepID=A0A2J6RPF3_HYAVF|nr:hypothetical protein L207DRAFT_428089 [Hyaloscypha variabilis F]
MAHDEAPATTGQTKHRPGEAGDQFQLQFVTTVSVNVPSNAEKKRTQKIIRQTVMKNFRQQQRTEKSKPKGKKRLAATSNSDPDAEEPDTDEPSSGASQFTSRSQSSSLSERGGKKGVEGSEHRRSSRISSHSPLDLGSPITPLGAGRVDPFRSAYADNNHVLHELIDHSITVIWPAFRPFGASEGLPNLPTSWFVASNSSPVAMHSMLFGAQVHLDVLRGPRMNIDNPVRLYHKIQTMRLLQEELNKRRNICFDEVILAILALLANEVETIANHIKENKIQSPFYSPLTDLQWLNIYGSISHIEAHVLALRAIVDQHGGLEKIKLEGLAEVVSFSDILGATQSFSKPHWPLLERTLKFGPFEIDESVRYPLTILGQSFAELKHFGINRKMASVLQSMVDLTIIIDCHYQGTKPLKDFTPLIDRRNWVQHALMALPSGDELVDDKVRSVCLYEAIRHVAFIYSAAVTFPLPGMSGHFHKLAALLQPMLEASKFDICWRHCPTTLLWILVLGGIASSETPERPWFVRSILMVTKVLKLSTWEQVTEIMEGFLWLDSACDAGGRILWAEVTTGRSPSAPPRG